MQGECKRDLRREDRGAFHVLGGRGQGGEREAVRLGPVCGWVLLLFRGIVGVARWGLRKGWEMISFEFWKDLCGSLCGGGLVGAPGRCGGTGT